jgi:hypothetical protein
VRREQRSDSVFGRTERQIADVKFSHFRYPQ